MMNYYYFNLHAVWENGKDEKVCGLVAATDISAATAELSKCYDEINFVSLHLTPVGDGIDSVLEFSSEEFSKEFLAEFDV